MVFAIHWHESAMDLHVFPSLMPPPTSLSTRFLWVFPVLQPWALVSWIQPGLVICFTLDNIHVSMLFSQNIPPLYRCFWTVVLEKTLESPLDCKEIQPVHPKRNQPCILIGRTDVEAETPILWPPDVKSWLIWKDPDAGSNLRWGEGDNRGWDHWMASPT